MRYHAIVNPNAGNGRKAALIASLRKTFPDILISQTKKRGDATRIARRSRSDILIAAGGDGTVNEVVNGILQRKRPAALGILPIGTANMFARHLGIPLDTASAITCIKKQSMQSVDVGCINGRYFLNAAGVGIDAAMFNEVAPALKKVFGQIAYSVAAVKTIFTYRPRKLIIHSGRRRIEGFYVIACNVGRYGPVLHVAPRARTDDGKLDVLIFQKPELADTFRYLMAVVIKEHRRYKDIVCLRTDHIRVTATEPALYHADAELCGHTPVDIQVRKGGISVICPKRRRKDIFAKIETLLQTQKRRISKAISTAKKKGRARDGTEKRRTYPSHHPSI